MPAAAGVDDAVFSALADANRRRLLTLVGQRGSATATELAAELPISRQAVQKHLAGLAAAGLLAPERSGREVHFRVTPAPLSEAMAWMATVGAEWDDRLAALTRRLDGSGKS
jgi:DNA-binding transcriptional ArsR family regulator